MDSRLATLLAIALLTPAGALAQSVTVRESTDPTTEPSPIINAAECAGTPTSDNLTFTWTPPSNASGNQIRIDVSDHADCAITNTTTGTHTGTVATSTAGTLPSGNTFPPTGGAQTITAAQVVSTLAAAGGNANCTSTDVPLYICVVYLNSGIPVGSGTNVQSTGNIPLQVLAPEAPTGVSVGPGDSALNVSWTASAGTVSASFYEIAATATDPSKDAATHQTGKLSGTSGRIDGLVNGVTYDVTVIALSLGSNPSPASAAVQGTPVPVADFWQQYKEAGGHEAGGCASGAAGPLALLGLAPLLARRRRS